MRERERERDDVMKKKKRRGSIRKERHTLSFWWTF
jgi:hypothetical protein